MTTHFPTSFISNRSHTAILPSLELWTGDLSPNGGHGPTSVPALLSMAGPQNRRHVVRQHCISSFQLITERPKVNPNTVSGAKQRGSRYDRAQGKTEAVLIYHLEGDGSSQGIPSNFELQLNY
jgi:hypothetical protein